ncbi:MAG: hypothetical protein PGN11_12885 [Quadrisphaera sp.]
MAMVSGSWFVLPEALSAKSSPVLVAADDEHFTAVTAHLTRARADLAERLAGARRAPGGSGQQALDRDQEVHRLTARLRALSRFDADLCLGRTVAADGTTTYIGRLGLIAHDDDGEPLLVDWRSPRRRTVLRRHHRAPAGPGEPSALPLGTS